MSNHSWFSIALGWALGIALLLVFVPADMAVFVIGYCVFLYAAFYFWYEGTHAEPFRPLDDYDEWEIGDNPKDLDDGWAFYESERKMRAEED